MLLKSSFILSIKTAHIIVHLNCLSIKIQLF